MTGRSKGGKGMNEAFRALPKEKQRRVLNAALAEFAQKEYKRASTDQIAARAGISKGSLFYYFKNKQTLYIYLVRQLQAMIERHLDMEKLRGITDFFEMLEYAIEEKAAMLRRMPHMMEFCIRMYYAAGGEIAPLMQRYTVKTLEEMYAKYFGGIDKSRFKPGVEPRQVLDMLIYLTDGYIHQQQMAGRAFDLDDMMRQYFLWRDILRQYAYKEEYQ